MSAEQEATLRQLTQRVVFEQLNPAAQGFVMENVKLLDDSVQHVTTLMAITAAFGERQLVRVNALLVHTTTCPQVLMMPFLPSV